MLWPAADLFADSDWVSVLIFSYMWAGCWKHKSNQTESKILFLNTNLTCKRVCFLILSSHVRSCEGAEKKIWEKKSSGAKIFVIYTMFPQIDACWKCKKTPLRLSVQEKTLHKLSRDWYLRHEICGLVMLHCIEPSAAKLTFTVLSAFSPRLSSSPSICGGISMKTTSRYLIHSPVPLAPGLTTVWHLRPSLCPSNPHPASCWFHFFSPEFDCRRAVDPAPSNWAKPNCSRQIWTECGHTGWFTGCCRPQDTCVFGHTPVLSFVFCCCPLIYAPQLWWTFWFKQHWVKWNKDPRSKQKTTVGQLQFLMRHRTKSFLKKWELRRNSRDKSKQMLGFMLRQPTNHFKSAARSVWNQPVSGCKFPPEMLENLTGDIGAWMWRNLLRASWSLCLRTHLGRERGFELAVLKVRVQPTCAKLMWPTCVHELNIITGFLCVLSLSALQMKLNNDRRRQESWVWLLFFDVPADVCILCPPQCQLSFKPHFVSSS